MTSKWIHWKSIGYFGSGIVAGAAVVLGIKDTWPLLKNEVKDSLNTGSKTSVKVHLLQKGNELNECDRTQEFKFLEKKKIDDPYNGRLSASIEKAEQLCQQFKAKHGLPGLTINVSVNGTTKWTQGFGYADLENNVKMTPESVVRIGSISKSMTMGMLGELLEENKIDLDLPIQTYVPNFPLKQVDGKDVTITTRHLLSHVSGIRHYMTKEELEANPNIDEMNLSEYFLKVKYKSVEEALKIFQNDQLLHIPGEKFTYSTYAWTLVSTVIEKITKVPFDKYAKRMFKTWGLENTFLDENEPIIYHRVRNYSWDKENQEIRNSEYVDNSYKWGGGGYLSNVGDVVKFAHIMLASYQNQFRDDDLGTKEEKELNRPYLKSETVTTMWTGDPISARPGRNSLYGLGFVIRNPLRKYFFPQSVDSMVVGHSGWAIGGSSILLMTCPKSFKFGYDETDDINSNQKPQVKGVVVAILTNLTAVPLNETAQEIANLFEWATK